MNRLLTDNGSPVELSGNAAPMTGTPVAREREHELAGALRIAKFGTGRWVLSTGAVVWSEEVYRIFLCAPALQHPRYEEPWGIYTPDTLPNCSREDCIRDGPFKWLRGAV